MIRKWSQLLLLAALVVCLGLPRTAEAVRIKDLATLQGVRNNQLVGYGLVVGLNGTGDSNSTDFTVRTLVNMMKSMGITVDPTKVKVNNVAAVMVTTDLPPFAKTGSAIDVLVSSIGDAKSLVGGTLLMTPLHGPD
ncbi:MAG TPA: flagellar basal body P-ring protein FlgI, partial [Desulfuromonadales bacterium]|nr:flagellar basal body P-ring protein FlgI [Desulfuromonadales bacterium]